MLREVKKTDASSAPPELAEVDAPAVSKLMAKLAAVWTPMRVAEPPPALRGVKLAKLLLEILDHVARRAFVHWVGRTDADSCVEESAAQLA